MGYQLFLYMRRSSKVDSLYLGLDFFPVEFHIGHLQSHGFVVIEDWCEVYYTRIPKGPGHESTQGMSLVSTQRGQQSL